MNIIHNLNRSSHKIGFTVHHLANRFFDFFLFNRYLFSFLRPFEILLLNLWKFITFSSSLFHVISLKKKTVMLFSFSPVTFVYLFIRLFNRDSIVIHLYFPVSLLFIKMSIGHIFLLMGRMLEWCRSLSIYSLYLLIFFLVYFLIFFLVYSVFIVLRFIYIHVSFLYKIQIINIEG